MTADLDRVYPPEWAQDWDAVGLVCGRGPREVTRALFAVDCVPETVAEALDIGAQLMITHHPLLLRGVSTVAPDNYKGEIVHTLIENGVALYVAHTNADVAAPGVSDALADRLGLRGAYPLVPVPGTDRGIGRIGRLPGPETLAEFTARVAAALPPTAWGVRAAGDPDRSIATVAVSGGAGDSYLRDAVAAGVDAFVTADLRHHPASEHLAADGPALVDAAHWATEWPWLTVEAARVRAAFGVDTVVSDHVTDPWTIHHPSS
ncbi:MAG: Nif3-like dinuclear metal center hexameric protein [Stackebrandtia sp.]